MYYCDGGDDYFSQYTLTTPWDISTKTDFKSISQSGESNCQGISIKDDGTVLYIVGSTGDGIDYYTLSTPWDITTRSSTAGHFSFGNTGLNPTGLFIKPNGGATIWATFRTAGSIQNSVTDGIAEFSFSAGGIKIPSTEAINKPPILDYQSTGDITLISKISNTKITSSKSSTLFNSSYGGINNTELKIVDNTDTTIEKTLTNKKISIENPASDSNGSIVTPKNSTGITINPTTKTPLEIPISSRYIGTEADKASLSPSFCNAVQLVIFTSNQTPLGYFERDGHGYFETITPQNDPRIGSGNSGGEGGDDGGGSESSSSGPIQTWSS
jgi:hypothetical protein